MSVCVDIDLVICVSVEASVGVVGVLEEREEERDLGLLEEKGMSGVLIESLVGLHLHAEGMSVGLLSILIGGVPSESVNVQPLVLHVSE